MPCKSDWGGWIHFLDGRTTSPAKESTTFKRTTPALTEMARRYSAAVTPTPLMVYARDMGLTTASLHRLGIGHDGRAWTFPMRDARERIVGIHRRLPDCKLMVKGSRLGLFIPDATDGTTGPLVVCEGMSDTAAALDCGFASVGLPSAGNGFNLMADLLRRLLPPRVVIVADLDVNLLTTGDVEFPGMRSALTLAERLMQTIRDLRFLLPPDGMKDIRQWLRETGANSIRQAVEQAPKVHRVWLQRVWAEYRQHQVEYRMPDWSRRAAALLNKIGNPERRASLRFQFEERAGIAEYDAGLPRDEAERLAFEEIRTATMAGTGGAQRERQENG
jgi:DNA primase